MSQLSTIEDVLNLMISYQEDTWSDVKTNISLKQTLELIQNEKLQDKINELRAKLQDGDKEYYDYNKKKLPAVTFSGSFDKRRTLSNLNQYNPIIVIDIDKLDTEIIDKIHSNLFSEQFVLSFWKSPSNNGFKGIVPLTYKLEDITDFDYVHKCAFRKLSQYFLETYEIELDKSGSDITRLCFLSSDKNLILKDHVSFFEILNDDIIIVEKNKEYSKQILRFSNSRDALFNPSNKNNQRDRRAMSDIIRFLYNKNKSITHDYDNWCKVAMAISNTFTFDIGLKYFKKLSILDKEKYNEITCSNFLTNCYETRKGEVNFNTIVYLANQQGYKTKYQKNGVPKAEELFSRKYHSP